MFVETLSAIPCFQSYIADGSGQRVKRVSISDSPEGRALRKKKPSKAYSKGRVANGILGFRSKI